MELDHIGGTYGGNNKPVAFMQLVLKVSLRHARALAAVRPSREVNNPDAMQRSDRLASRLTPPTPASSDRKRAQLLQIQPEKEIVVEFIRNEDFKYVRALGAFYMRMVGKALDVYQYLEPLLNDYRKLRGEDTPGSDPGEKGRKNTRPVDIANPTLTPP
jgi:hypothetical protein